MYQQAYDPVVHSLGLSAIFAAAPLTVMFVMLGGFKRSPQVSALVSLLACIAVAVLVYGTPLPTAVNFALYGAAFSLLTVIWIILNAIWIYNLTVASGHFAVLRQSFARLSDDPRIQGIIVAFCFGALIYSFIISDFSLKIVYENSSTITVTDLGKIFIRNVCMGFDYYLRQKNGHQRFSRTI